MYPTQKCVGYLLVLQGDFWVVRVVTVTVAVTVTVPFLPTLREKFGSKTCHCDNFRDEPLIIVGAGVSGTDFSSLT